MAPSLYAEAPHPTYQPAEEGRDAFEVETIRLALERDMPMLAICRGMQVLNVVCGGTLWQDRPSERPSETPHRVKEPRDARAHVVEIADGSRLRQLLAADAAGAPSLPVNSRHHQALKHVAPGFVVTATAPDGVIEAVERPASRFCLGVQWHPENFWRTGEFVGVLGNHDHYGNGPKGVSGDGAEGGHDDQQRPSDADDRRRAPLRRGDR